MLNCVMFYSEHFHICQLGSVDRETVTTFCQSDWRRSVSLDYCGPVFDSEAPSGISALGMCSNSKITLSWTLVPWAFCCFGTARFYIWRWRRLQKNSSVALPELDYMRASLWLVVSRVMPVFQRIIPKSELRISTPNIYWLCTQPLTVLLILLFK